MKHFFCLFARFQGHWPILHIPTCDLSSTYDGLITAISCAGSVYSDRISLSQVRDLVDIPRGAVQRTSTCYKFLQPPVTLDSSLGISDIREMHRFRARKLRGRHRILNSAQRLWDSVWPKSRTFVPVTSRQSASIIRSQMTRGESTWRIFLPRLSMISYRPLSAIPLPHRVI